MALATKCPQCGAMFRVVADQLKLRGGLVRCGQCRTVFDAIGSLAYVEDATLSAAQPEDKAAPKHAESPAYSAGPPPPPTPPPSPAPAPSRNEAERPRSGTDRKASVIERNRDAADRKRRALGPSTTLRIAPGAAPVATVSQELPPAPAERPGRRTVQATPAEEPTLAESGVPTLLAPGPLTDATAADAASLDGIEVIEVAAPPESPAIAAAAPAEEPAFVRATREKPQRSFSIVFGGGSVVLLLLAAIQLAIVFRAEVLTRWPGSRPALVQLCSVFACSLGWPTRPDQLAVIGSELQQIPGTDVLELTAVIRNRAPFTQALPALEVTLSDTQNRPVARKVFGPADYLAAAGEPRTRLDEGLGAGADMTIRLHFEARGLQPAGFLVYPFYI